MRALLLFLLLAFGQVAQAQPEQYAAKTLRAIQKFVLKTTPVDSIAKVITSASAHSQLVTAKAVYDYVLAHGGGGGGTVSVTARLSGDGSSGDPLDIAQNGALTDQVLRWSGTDWIPSWGNAYTYVTANSSITASVNTVLIGTLSSNVVLGLPTCNLANDSKQFTFQKSGTDTAFGATIDPSGAETFSDGTATKVLYSTGVGILCTCRYASGSGSWFFTNM